MDANLFNQETKKVYDQVFNIIDQFDPDEIEADQAQDNIKILFANGVQFILNKQAAVSQLWLATKKRGYHFNFDDSRSSWICDHTGQEFFALLSDEVSEQAKKSIQF